LLLHYGSNIAAVKRNNLAVLEIEHIAAWHIDRPPHCSNDSRRKDRIALVRPANGKLDNNDVPRHVDTKQRAVNVWKHGSKRTDVTADGLAAKCCSSGNVSYVPIVGESGNKRPMSD
jgi:hypothetical protein